FFSSRRRHTRSKRDWSSDVCSSDLRHKTADLMMENDEKIGLDPKSEGFYLLQRIQDEVHRFAITFHRQVRSKNSLASRLERIQGVGPKTRIKRSEERRVGKERKYRQ